MDAQPLHHVWQYTEVDRTFWNEHLEDWVPAEIIDAHLHLYPARCELEELTDEMRRQYWVNELFCPIDEDQLERAYELTFPGRTVGKVVMGYPSLSFDTELNNQLVAEHCRTHGYGGLVLLRPQWSVERLRAELDRPGFIGVKPYYAMISHNPASRDEHIEASIFDFLPHEHLQLLDARRAWITLHVPRAGRLADPANLDEVRRLRDRYPSVRLVIAHLGRSYTLPHAEAALPALADDPGLYWDISAVLNPDVLALALETIGPDRLLYGTDNPIFFMRGRRQWEGTSYRNRTNYPFHFNAEREPPEVEARYTLYMYEALRALRSVCENARLSDTQVNAIFRDNAATLLDGANTPEA